MVQLLSEIRNAARAVILRDDKILLLKKEGGGVAACYTLPGGGQQLGEPLLDTLRRECEEEIGVAVSIGSLLHIADFFKNSHSQPGAQRHQLEFLFLCSVPTNYTPANGPHPDKRQTGVEWVDCAVLPRLPLSPNYLSCCLPLNPELDYYLGTFYDQSLTQEY